MLHDYLSIGQVLKPQGIRGEVRVRTDTDDAARLCSLSTVYFRNGDHFEAHSIRNINPRDGFFTCILDESTTRNDAESYRGQVLYVDRAHARPLGENEYYIQDLIGCRMITDTGRTLGTILDVLQAGGNDVLEIRGSTGSTLYMPLINRLIQDARLDENVLIVYEKTVQEVTVFDN